MSGSADLAGRAARPAGPEAWEGYLRSLPLRERKKVRTKVAIQERALGLFGEKGYEATTVEEVAEAAEVATRTVFRYFPTKDELVLWDAFDEGILERGRPHELLAASEATSPVGALLGMFEQGLAEIEAIDPEGLRLRMRLIDENPSLATAAWARARLQGEELADSVAVQFGRPVGDPELRVVVAAVIGALFQGGLEWARADYRPVYGDTVVSTPMGGQEVLARVVARLAEGLDEVAAVSSRAATPGGDVGSSGASDRTPTVA